MNFKEFESEQKLRGGYYTPLDLASFIAEWTSAIKPKTILEPSCGDGIFFEALAKIRLAKRVTMTGFELNDAEAEKASARMRSLNIRSAEVRQDDFLEWALRHLKNPEVQFDAVVGNPPFIRYQFLPELFQIRAEMIFRELGLPFTKHTNAWVPFILASVALLRPGGRIAMVVPSEIIHIPHAQSLRTYLGKECNRIVLIDPEELWFDDTLQGAVILLAEKKQKKTDVADGLGIYPVKGREFLKLSPETIFAEPHSINGKTVQGKWTRALLNDKQRALFDEFEAHASVFKFKDIAKVDVGIVTGANKFFHVSDETVETFGLEKYAHPMFGRSEHCPGIIYDESQHTLNATKGSPTNFLWFDESALSDDRVKAYIESGETQNLHTRFKCRVRSPWYTVPSVYATEIGLLKRAHHVPRLILNRMNAYTTDTAYRIRTENVAAESLVGCFINPLTALSAELEGRHYGGGVLELVPSEIERLLLPMPKDFKADVKALDNDIRTLHADVVLERHGAKVLGGLGFGKPDIDSVMDAWNGLRNRRQRTSEPAASN
ncbi:MAG: N-6 DNA methylase [Pyrinomonadaceae bacterium]